MELETLEIIFDANTEQIEKKMMPFLKQMQDTMDRLSSISNKGVSKFEKNIASTAGFDKAAKNFEKLSVTADKQFNKMEKRASDTGKNSAALMTKGFSQGTAKMTQDVQAAVDKVNLKMQQAKAAQQKIANLQGDRNGAAVSGNGKAVSKIDEKIANAQIQMNRAQSDAQAVVRKLKAEHDQVKNAIDQSRNALAGTDNQLEAQQAQLKKLNALYDQQIQKVSKLSQAQQQAIYKKHFDLGTADPNAARKEIDSHGYDTIEDPRAAKTKAALAKVQASIDKLSTKGGNEADALGKYQQRLKSLEKTLEGLNTELGETAGKSSMATNGMRNLSGQTKQTSSLFSRFRNVFNNSIGRIGSKFQRQSQAVSNGTRQMSNSMGGFGRTMRMLWSQLFIFSFLYQGIMALAGGLWSALKTNDQFSNSLNQIKVNLLTAFYPIYSAVMPALNALMSGIAKVTGYIASFIAMLFGTTYSAAKQGAQGLNTAMEAMKDTGKSVGGAGEEMDNTRKKAKKLQQMLMGFDEINTLSFDDGSDDDPDSPKSDAGGAPGIDWSGAEPETPAWLTNFANKFKEIMSKLFDPIKKAWDAQGQKVIDAWKYALGEVMGLIQAIGRSFMEVWTNGTGQRFVENLLILLADVLSIVGDIAGAFRRAWEDGGRGTALIQSIFDMFNSILELLHEIAVAFRAAWNDDGLGERIAAHLLEIFTNIFNVVGNLADSFKRSWKEGKLGESIFKTILRIIEKVLGRINNMTKATAEWAKELDFTPLLKSIDSLLKSIEPLADNIGAGLEWFYKNVLLPLASFTIEDLIPAFINLLAGAIDLLNGVIKGLQPLFDWLWNNFLQPVANWAGGVIVDVLNNMADALSRLGEWISQHSEGFSLFVGVLGTFAGLLKIISALSTVGSILSGVFSFFSSIGSLAGVLTTVGQAIGTIVGLLGGPLTVAIALAGGAFVLAYSQCEPFRQFINGLLEDIRIFAEKVYTEYIEPAITEVVKFFQESFEKIKKFWDDYGAQFLQACKNAFSIIWAFLEPWLSAFANIFKVTFEGVIQFIQVAWDTIKGIFQGAFQVIGGMIKVFTGVFTLDFRLAWDGVKDIFEGAWQAISSGLQGFINGLGTIVDTIKGVLASPIVGAMNFIIRGINWVLSAVNAEPLIDEFPMPQYARGTAYHPGGPALVNDAPGAQYQEMFKLPDGRMGMFPKQRNLMVDLPQGSQVLPAGMVPNYASGIFGTFKEFFSGVLDSDEVDGIWHIISNPSRLIEEAMSRFANFSDLLEPVYSIASGTLKTAKNAAVSMVVDMINSFTGFANGGLVDRFGFYQMAEGNNAEMVVPLSKPQLAFERINEALDFMGYEGIPDLTMPDVFRSSTDGYSGSTGASGHKRSMSFSGNGMENLNVSLISSLGDKIANAIMMAISSLNLGGNDDPFEIILEVDSTRLGEVTIKGINKVTQKTGVFPLNI